MPPDSNLRVAQEFFQLYFGGKAERAVALLDDQVVYRVPGLHPPAGVFVGPDAVADHLRDLLALLGSPIDVLQWEDWMVGIDHVAAVVSVHLQREGENHDFRLVLLVRVSDKERIREIEVFFAGDQEAFDRFFAGAS